MILCARFSLVAVLALAPILHAQEAGSERPQPYTPLHPETRRELNHSEAVRLYGLAAMHEHNNRFIEALRVYEQARDLDPESAAPYKALVHLYLALDRLEEALNTCRKALEIDPGDHETWILFARQLRAQNRPQEAATALGRALACPGLKEHLDLFAQVAFDQGVLYENLKQYDKAETAFLEVVGILDNPAILLEQGDFDREDIAAQATETYERLGRLSLGAGKPDRARDYFLKAHDKVKEKNPIQAKRLAYNLAQIHLSNNQWAEALPLLNEYLETQPQSTEAYQAKIKVLEQLGRPGEIVPALEAYAQRDRFNVGLKLLLAEQVGRAGNFAQAEAKYLEIARTSSGPDLYRGLFKLYAESSPPQLYRLVQILDEALGKAAPQKDHELGDASAAVQAQAMLLVLREDGPLVKKLIPVAQQVLNGGQILKGQTNFFLGVLASRTGQLEAAEQFYRGCLNPRSRQGFNLQEAEAYQNLLQVLYLSHKHEAIVQVCREGLERAQGGDRVLFHVKAAQALSRLGRFPEAIAEASAAVEAASDPNRLFCRSVRVQILASAQHFDQAIAECREMLKEHTRPEEVRNIRHTLSIVYTTAHDQARAEEQLRMILQADPNDATANNDLGYIWADQDKNLEEAEKLVRKAIDLDHKQRQSGREVDVDSDRDNAAYIDSLGWVLFHRGKLAEARRELEKAVVLPDGADDPVVWDHLADVCYRLGDAHQAVAAWRKAVTCFEQVRERQTDKRYDEIKQKLKLLEPNTP